MARDYATSRQLGPATDSHHRADGPMRGRLRAGGGGRTWRPGRSFTAIVVTLEPGGSATVGRPGLGVGRGSAHGDGGGDRRRWAAMRMFTFGAETELAAALTIAAGGVRRGSRDGPPGPSMTSRSPLPEGLEVRPIGSDMASRRPVWDASTEAFADERGEAVPTEEDWQSPSRMPVQDPSPGRSPSTAGGGRRRAGAHRSRSRTPITAVSAASSPGPGSAGHGDAAGLRGR